MIEMNVSDACRSPAECHSPCSVTYITEAGTVKKEPPPECHGLSFQLCPDSLCGLDKVVDSLIPLSLGIFTLGGKKELE